ncbi:Stress response protein nst1, partial [Dipsacomyces acuminosporus]
MGHNSKRRGGRSGVMSITISTPTPQSDKLSTKRIIYSKDGTQRIDLVAAFENADLADEHGKELTIPVFGPELPPSMLREKADGSGDAKMSSRFTFIEEGPTTSSVHAVQLSGAANAFHNADIESKVQHMEQARSDLERLFREKLLSVMDGPNIEHKIATVKAAENALKSGDKPGLNSNVSAVAMTPELKSEILNTLVSNMKHIPKKDMDLATLESCLADVSMVDLVLNKFRQAFDDYALSNSATASSQEAIIKSMQSASLADLGNEIKLRSSTSGPTQRNTQNKAGSSLSQRKKKNRKKKAKKTKKTKAAAQDGYVQGNDSISNGPEETSNRMQQTSSLSQTQPIARSEAGLIAPVAPASAPASVPASASATQSTAVTKQKKDTKAIWNNDRVEEQKQVRKFWLSLSDIERQALVLVEKEVVLARVREHQNFACNCNVCTRKREAIEHELDCLYDCYYEELKESVRKEKLRIAIREAEFKAKLIITTSVAAITESVIEAEIKAKPDVDIQGVLERAFGGGMTPVRAITSLFYSRYTSSFMGEAVQRAALMASSSDSAKTQDATQQQTADSDAAISASKVPDQSSSLLAIRQANVDRAASAIKEWAVHVFDYCREFGDEPFPSDDEEDGTFDNNDLFYTENLLGSIDTFPTDSKKFFDMMERLAEYRMRREDAMLDSLADNDDISIGNDGNDIDNDVDNDVENDGASGVLEYALRQVSSKLDSHHIHRCPDCQGEISESEATWPFPDADGKLSTYATKRRARSASHNRSSLADNEGESDDYDEDDEDDLLDDDEDDDDDGDDEDDHDDDDEDDDYDDMDPERAEKQAEESRRVFQLFAARLFEQRIITAYRERVARERQRKLIEELEEEEKRSKAKEKRKQKKKEREKEKKRQIQQQKEDERLAREAQLRSENERKAAAEERRRKEHEQKKREEEARIRKAQEERNRRILEMADKRMEKERLEREKREREQQEARDRRKQEREQEEQRRAIEEAQLLNSLREKKEKEKQQQLEQQRQVKEQVALQALAGQHASATQHGESNQKIVSAPIPSMQQADAWPLQTRTAGAVLANNNAIASTNPKQPAMAPTHSETPKSHIALPPANLNMAPIIEAASTSSYLASRPPLPMTPSFDTTSMAPS